MSIINLNFTIEGFAPLLLNNPQCVDPLNEYTKLKKPLTSKRNKTDEDYAELADLEMRSKIYWDDELKIYIPSSWVQAAINKVCYSTSKISKAAMRGGVFMNEPKIKLEHREVKKVKTPEDIIKNGTFRHKMNLKQGQVMITKYFPIFHEWEISSSLEFDDSVTTGRDLKLMLEKACKYGGFGDFRPTFGRALLTECSFD